MEQKESTHEFVERVIIDRINVLKGLIKLANEDGAKYPTNVSTTQFYRGTQHGLETGISFLRDIKRMLRRSIKEKNHGK